MIKDNLRTLVKEHQKRAAMAAKILRTRDLPSKSAPLQNVQHHSIPDSDLTDKLNLLKEYTTTNQASVSYQAPFAILELEEKINSRTLRAEEYELLMQTPVNEWYQNITQLSVKERVTEYINKTIQYSPIIASIGLVLGSSFLLYQSQPTQPDKREYINQSRITISSKLEGQLLLEDPDRDGIVECISRQLEGKHSLLFHERGFNDCVGGNKYTQIMDDELQSAVSEMKKEVDSVGYDIDKTIFDQRR